MLVLTALGTVHDKVRGLDAGANDYLVKPFEFEELFARLRAIRRVYSGEGPYCPDRLVGVLPGEPGVYSPYDGRIHSHRTRELAAETVRREPAAHLHSRDQILREVFDATDLPGTVDTYVHYVRRKTDPDMITTDPRTGLPVGAAVRASRPAIDPDERRSGVRRGWSGCRSCSRRVPWCW